MSDKLFFDSNALTAFGRLPSGQYERVRDAIAAKESPVRLPAKRVTASKNQPEPRRLVAMSERWRGSILVSKEET